jgi:CHAT domain-containing protein
MVAFRFLSIFVVLVTFVFVLLRPAEPHNVSQSRQVQQVSPAPPCKGIPIKPGSSIQQELIGGSAHCYKIELAVNDFLRVLVDQKGIDVVLTIFAPDGQKVSEVDRPTGSRGKETISVIAGSAGSYTLEVRSLESVAAEGQYFLSVDPSRPAVGQDSTGILAEQTVSEAERLRARGSAESLRMAIKKFDRAAALWAAVNQPYEEAIALYGSGLSCTSLSENQTAIQYLARAIALFDGDEHGKGLARAAIAWPYMYLGDYDQAFQNFSLAFELYHNEENVRGEGIALYGIGWVDALRGQNEEALKNFSESLSRRRIAQDRRGEALTLTGLAKIEGRLGNYSKVLAYFQQALQILPTPHDRYVEADILSNLGWVHSALGQNTLAMDYFQCALPLRQLTGDSIGEATTLYGISSIERRLHHLQEAQQAIEEALGIIESLRLRGTNQQLRISYFASIQDYYDFYISILMERHNLQPSAAYAAKALQACERARARGLIDLLAEARIDLRRGVAPSVINQERTISEKLGAVAEHQPPLANNEGPEEEQALALKARDLSNQFEAVKGAVRSANPAYAALIQPQPLSAPEIQKQLDNETVLIEYALGRDRSYAWSVTATEVRSYELPAREGIESLVHQFYDALTERNRVEPAENREARRERFDRADVTAGRDSRELSRMLLWPIHEVTGTKRIIFVSTGALQFVPFAALVERPSMSTEDNAAAALQSSVGAQASRPLMVDHEIVVLPSATTLAVIRKQTEKRKPQTKAVAVIGDPVFSSSDDRLQLASNSTLVQFAPDAIRQIAGLPVRANGWPTERGSQFPRLISSRWEANRIVSLVPRDAGKLFLDFAASRETALSGELGRYRFVHFATHALIDDDPNLSGIVLSLVDDRGHQQNGFLSTNDIFTLKLPVELVVLSACRTGLGKDIKGEGLVGLTRGFMYAGVPRIVVSLWNVEDKPTSELMVRLYKFMLGPEKLSPAAALRKAQLELWQDPRWQSPYFWAPFILQGEWK